MSEVPVTNTTVPAPEEEEQEDGRFLYGRITSGMPLSVEARKRITQRFEEILKTHVKMSCRIDKSLIAGIRVEIDGCSYDGSVLGQLKNLDKMLTRHDEEEL